MKYKNPKTIELVLDATAIYKVAARVAEITGVSRVTLYRMGIASEKGDPDFQEVEWAGVFKPYHEHLEDALDMHVEDVQQRMLRDAAEGRYVDDVVGGCYHYVECEYFHSLTPTKRKDQLEMSEEDRDFYGYPRIWHDGYKRNWNGRTQTWERERVQRFIPPTVEAQGKVLAAFAPALFGDKRSVSLEVSGGLGVSVIGQTLRPSQQVIDITPVAAITDASEIEFNDTEYQPWEAAMAKTFTPDPNSSLTEEQQRILARSRSTNPRAQELAARAAQKLVQAPVAPKPMAPLLPPASTYRGDDQDDTVQRAPRGYKVV